MQWQEVWLYLAEDGQVLYPRLAEVACAKFLQAHHRAIRGAAAFLERCHSEANVVTSWRRYPPLRLLTRPVRDCVVRALAGHAGPRACAVAKAEQRLGRILRGHFLAGDGYRPGQYLWLVCRHDFWAMARLQPPFDRCSRSEMNECIESIARDAVQDRRVLIGFLEDRSAGFPADLWLHFERFESVTSFDDRVLLQRSKRLPMRAWYQAGGGDGEEVRYAAEQLAQLRSLRPWVKHELTGPAILKELERFVP